MKRLLLTIFVQTMLFNWSVAQGTLLILPEETCELTVNGELEKELIKDKPFKIELPEGEHLIQGKSKEGLVKNEIIEITDGKQKILKISFSEKMDLTPKGINNESETRELVADLTVKLNGGINGISDNSINLNIESNELYYAFEEGDKIYLDGDIENKKGKFYIKLIKYPEGRVIYSKQKLSTLKNHIINIRQRSIYVIQFGTSAFFDKNIKLTIERAPKDESTRNFNTTVNRNVRYNTVPLVQPTSHYINSQQNEIWKGGKDDISIPVLIPEGLDSWYYTISASRNQEDIKSNLTNFSLAGDLVKALGGASPTTAAIKIGLDLIAQPPGSAYCDVYLLDQLNYANYKSGLGFVKIQEGTRENVKSASVSITQIQEGQFHLSLKNRSNFHGLHVGIEAVGIEREYYLEYADSTIQNLDR